MAISKLIFNGDVQMDVTGDTVASNNLLSGYQATGANGLRVSGSVTVPTKTSDLTNDGSDGTHPFISDAGVTSFNGNTGAVTYTAPVTSVNGSTGAVVISVPTKTSDLTNDSGYITDAGVTSFNGNTGAVTYTAPVTSVNGNTGAVTVSVPTKVSDLTNDSGFLTTAVTSFNGDTGAVTYTAPVTSVNGSTGAVTIDVPADWFGVGTKLGSTAVDLDDITTPGRYWIGSSDVGNVTHIPTGYSQTAEGLALYVAPTYNVARPFQAVWTIGGRYFYRAYNGSTWSSWLEAANVSDMLSVLNGYASKSGDTLTGSYYLKDANFPTTAPATNYWANNYVQWKDAENKTIGYFTSVFRADGFRGLEIGNERYVNGVAKYNGFNLGIDNDGNQVVIVSQTPWRNALGMLTWTDKSLTAGTNVGALGSSMARYNAAIKLCCLDINIRIDTTSLASSEALLSGLPKPTAAMQTVIGAANNDNVRVKLTTGGYLQVDGAKTLTATNQYFNGYITYPYSSVPTT